MDYYNDTASHYLVFTIINLILGFFSLPISLIWNIPALLFSKFTIDANDFGNYDSAWKWSKWALIQNIVALILNLIFLALVIFLIVFFAIKNDDVTNNYKGPF